MLEKLINKMELCYEIADQLYERNESLEKVLYYEELAEIYSYLIDELTTDDEEDELS